MPRKETSPQVYEVAEEFRARCLEQNGSLLWDRAKVWTVDYLRLIKEHFIDVPEVTTKDGFWDKLKKQFAGLPEECFMILADAFVIYSLPSSFLTREMKISFLERVRESGGPELPPLAIKVTQALSQGLAHTTFHYHAKYKQIWLLLLFALRLKKEATENILADPWATAQLLDECLYSLKATDRAYDMRHALLHMLFPDFFERVISTEHKTQIINAFLSPAEVEAVQKEYPSETQQLQALDRLLLLARERLQRESPGLVGDFYSPELKRRWQGKEDPSSPGSDDILAEPFSTLFTDREEAVWAFEFMKRVIIGLGLGVADDPRLVLSLTSARGGKALHLDFCSWLVLGFNPPANEPSRFEILLRESTAPLCLNENQGISSNRRRVSPNSIVILSQVKRLRI